MTVGQRIRNRRKELNMSADDLAAKLGKDRSTIFRYESDQIKNMPIEVLEPISKALDVDPAYLMGWEDSKPVHKDLKPVMRRKIPMLGEVAAGVPMYAEREYEEFDNDDTSVSCDYVLRVKGDSMEPKVIDGDIVYVRSQPDVDDGQIGVVCVDDSVTLKVVYHIPGGLHLISLNPKYKPMTYTIENSDHLAILGLAVAYKRML